MTSKTSKQEIEIAMKAIIEGGKVASNLIDINNKINSEDLKDPTVLKAKKESLIKSEPLLDEICKKLWIFQQNWAGSDIQGDLIDWKLFDSNKVDFKQMKKIMQRSYFGNTAITGLDLISKFVVEYEARCTQVGLSGASKRAMDSNALVAFQINNVERDIGKLSLQLNNVNLYYQNRMVSIAVKVAYASLFVSSLAFILTILQATHLIG